MKKFYFCLALLFGSLSFQANAYETSSFNGKTYCFRESTAKTEFDNYAMELNKIDKCLSILNHQVSDNLSSAMLNGNYQFYSHAFYNLVKGLVAAEEAYNLDDLEVAKQVAFSSHNYIKDLIAHKPYEYYTSDDMRLHELSQRGSLDVNRLKTCEALIETIRLKLTMQKTAYVKEMQNILKSEKCMN